MPIPIICERDPRSGESSCDAEVETSEIRFAHSLAAAEAEDLQTETDPDDWRNDGAAEELLRRWWRRPVRASELFEAPHRILAGLGVRGDDDESPESARDDVQSLPGSEGGIRPANPLQRQITLEIASRRMAIKPTGVRLFDPIPESSLATLPPDVVADILAVLERCDRQVVADVRPIVRALRIICEPLKRCSVQTVSPSKYRRRPRHSVAGAASAPRPASTRLHGTSPHCADINLRYRGREYCLLRFAAPYRVADVSDRSGRAIGGIATILAEDDEGLLREIARYHDRLQARLPLCQSPEQMEQVRLDAIDPSARRFTQGNPFLAAPEDRLSLEECFYRERGDDPESDVEPTAVEDLPSWERYTQRHSRPSFPDKADGERTDHVSESRHRQRRSSRSRSTIRPAHSPRSDVAAAASNSPIIIRPGAGSRSNSQDSAGNRSESP
ncbi:MAG: hypothetical protein ACK5Q5_07175 [Planctomycetaceae bacterium]